MRKLILEEWLSMDGYVAGKNGELDYFPSTASNNYADHHQLEFMEGIDAILMGRITYNLFVDFWPAATTDTEIIADKLNSIPKIVFSNTLKNAPWGKWPEVQIIPGDAAVEIKKLKEQEGKNMVIWGSISLAQTCITAGLVDEYRLHICPTAIGGGRLLFPNFDQYKKFRLVESRNYETGVMYLKYIV